MKAFPFRIPAFALRSGATTGARLSAVASLLCLMALASRRFSAQEFGLWSIFYALMNFASAADFGFRFGLGNRLAALRAVEGSQEERRETFLAILHLELGIGLTGMALCLAVLRRVNWAHTFHIQDAAFGAQAQWLFPLICGLLMLNQPLTMAATALFADHQIEYTSGLAVIQSVFLAGAFWVASYHGTFAAAVLGFFGCYLLAGLAVTVLCFRRLHWHWSWPGWRRQWAVVQSMRKPSIDFFILSISAMAAATIGPLLAGAVGGVRSAGDFSLLQRLFGLLVAIHMAALAPLSPAYTFRARQGDWEWVGAKLGLCLRVIWPLLFLGGGLAMVAAHPLLMRVWSGKWLTDYPLATLFALTAILAGWGNTYSILLNSLGAVRLQAILAIVMIVPVVALPLLLGRYFGNRGVAGGACLCYLPGAIFAWRYGEHVLKTRHLQV